MNGKKNKLFEQGQNLENISNPKSFVHSTFYPSPEMLGFLLEVVIWTGLITLVNCKKTVDNILTDFRQF